MKLFTINNVLRRIGVVLVVETPAHPDGWIVLRVARASRHPKTYRRGVS